MVEAKKKKINWIEELSHLVKPLTGKLNKEEIKKIAGDISRSLSLPPGLLERAPEAVAEALSSTLVRMLRDWRGEDDKIAMSIRSNRDLYFRTPEGIDRREILAKIVEEHGDSWTGKPASKKDIGPYLDWDAVEENLAMEQWNLWILQKITLEAIEGLYVKDRNNPNSIDTVPDLNRVMETSTLVVDYLDHGRHFIVRRAAATALKALLHDLPKAGERVYELYGESLLKHLDDVDEDLWVRLNLVDILGLIPMEETKWRLLDYMRNPDEKGDGFLFRAHALRAFVTPENATNELAEEMNSLMQVESTGEYVRIAIVKAVEKFDPESGMELLLKLANKEIGRPDSEISVRARMVETMAYILRGKEDIEFLIKRCSKVFSWFIAFDKSQVVRETARNEALTTILDFQERNMQDEAGWLVAALIESLSAATNVGEAESVAGLLEELRIGSNEKLLRFKSEIEGIIAGLSWGGTCKIKRPDGISEDDVMRILACISLDDAGLYVRWTKRKLKLTRGERFRRTTWRILHELRNWKPTSRPDILHTQGRKYKGNQRAHPKGLAEVTPTQVPGERRYEESESGWARFLPLVDDCLDARRNIYLFSSFGKTTIERPSSIPGRIKAAFSLNWKYSHWNWLRYDMLRQEEPSMKSAYTHTLKTKFGFEISFASWKYELFGIPVDLGASRVLAYFERERSA